MSNSIQLIASVAKGTTKTPEIVQTDGSQSAFVIPPGLTFTVTDISIQRLSVVGTSGLFEVALTQTLPHGGTENRWTFVGMTSGNIERAFTSGICFSTQFVVANGSQSADVAVVRLWGFFA